MSAASRRLATAAVLAIVLAASLAACGKKGAPVPPGPAADVTFPKVYPSR